jgi:hypothetical protein
VCRRAPGRASPGNPWCHDDDALSGVIRFPDAKRWLLALTSAGLTLLAVELGLRAMVAPSSQSAGRLLGSELPPVRLIPSDPPRRVHRVWSPGRIRRDDLGGVFRPDPTMGYAPREDATSTNGWWQSNNLGARATHDTAPAVAPGTTRVLVFGDSFAAGSRVPQESAWPALIESMRPGLEVVNFGVDGYGTGQSLLRYRTLRGRLDHQVVVLTVSPRADFWRDVNTLRALAGWRSFLLMPRFVLENRRLRLVRDPYDPPQAIYTDNRAGPSPRLVEHLRRYDRFYVPWMYEPSPGLLDRSVLVKFLRARWAATLLRRRHWEVLAPDSEAVAVTVGIAARMRHDAAVAGARFVLVLLPSERDVKQLRRSASYRAQWRAIAERFARAGVPPVDLAPDFLAAPPEQLDRGFDGTHHGPRSNRMIAEAIGRALDR